MRAPSFSQEPSRLENFLGKAKLALVKRTVAVLVAKSDSVRR
jgi:hypothetical protein